MRSRPNGREPWPKPSKTSSFRDCRKTDLALLEPHLEPVDLPLRKVLGRANKKITAVYFPESGFASVVVNTGKPIEVGLIGREGMTGLPVVLGGDRSDNETYMQAAGQGQCMRANELRNAIEKSRTLHSSMLRYRPRFPQSDRRRRPLPMVAPRSRNAWRVGCSWLTTVWDRQSCRSRMSFWP